MKRRVIAFVGLFVWGAAAPIAAQRLVVEVTHVSSNVLVEGMAVFVLQASDTVGMAVTGPDGRAVFDLKQAGRYTVLGGGAGWAETRIADVNVESGARVFVAVVVAASPVRLDPIDVEVARRPSWQAEHPWWEWTFRERQDWYGRLGNGRFYTEEQLRAYVDVSAILSVRVRPRRMGLNNNCGTGTSGWAVYVDGAPAHNIEFEHIHPADLFGVEVYRGPSNTPAELAGIARPCGAIVLWTKREYQQAR